MSSDDDFNDVEHSSTIVPDSKKRRVQRACDTCRRKKIRCDGAQMPGNRCSNCITYSLECTYVEAAKKRGPPKGYIESLENRLEKMEKLLQNVCPDADFSQELGGGRIDRESWLRGNVGASNHSIAAPSPPYSNTNTPLEDLAPSDDEEIGTLSLCEDLKQMNLNPNPHRGNHFFGKSSGVMLIQKAIVLKKEATGSDDVNVHFFRDLGDRFPWEIAAQTTEVPEYVFPDEDLAMTLVHLYFHSLNSLIPVLHRPSFERKIAEGVHLHDPAFAAVYLLVCACASRYSDDPRVFLDGVESKILEQSAGWKFFQQVQMMRRTLLGPPCLEDLQTCCLSVIYLQGTSAPQACWTIIGIGIRLAQDVGAHRRKSYVGRLSVEGELWKRAFWVLVVHDRQMSAFLGRPCAIQDEDFDLDLPLECDDEYWENPDPEQSFKQPPDKPSTLSFFISFIKLINILSFAHRTIYSINKSKIFLGFVGPQWEQHIVAELDSSLNKWIDEVPDHLRWDPTRAPDSIFFLQSSALYANYYQVQIFIHRPFIPSPRKPSPLSFPSLAICTNAARSCSHVIDIFRQRSNESPPFFLMAAFTAGIVLLLDIWGGKRSGLSIDPSKEMADVYKCMAALKACESRWHTSGKLWDILYELASVGDLPLPQPSPQGGTKREREPDSPTLVSRALSTPKESARTMAGTRRISRESHIQPQQPRQHQQSSSHPPVTQPSPSYNLPVYSNDLGRLPLHGLVNFPTTGSVTSSMSERSSDIWFTSLTSETRAPTNPAPVSVSLPVHAPVVEHPFALGGAYSMDDLFFDQMPGAFGGFSAQPTGHAPSSSGPVYDSATNELRALADTVGADASHMVGTNADVDTIAMWSSAPTGFAVNDWGAYISNVSGNVNLGGLAGARSHGQPQRQRAS